MAIASILSQGKPILFKKGLDQPLFVDVISNDAFSQTQTIKTKIHRLVGDTDSYEYIGQGDRKISLTFFIQDEDGYNELMDYIADGSALLLICDFFPQKPIKIDGDVKIENYISGWGKVTANFTTAEKDFDDEQELLLAFSSFSATSGETPASKLSLLDKMNDWADRIGKGVSKTNEYVGNVTNNIAAYSAAFTNVLSGISSGASIITNPISSIKQSISDVTGGLSSVISSLQNVILTIKQLPDDFQSIIDSFSLLGDQLNNLFDLGNSNENNKYNTEFLLKCSEAVMNIDLSPDNEDIVNESINSGTDSLNTEFFLPSVNKPVNDVISVLTLCSLLINIYENAEKINRWNTIDLENLRKKSEAIYSYITTFELDTELLMQIDLARNRFFKIFKILWDKAYKIVEFQITEPNFLENLVFSVNGNLDFFNDTKKLNNVIGGIVQAGTVKIISND